MLDKAFLIDIINNFQAFEESKAMEGDFQLRFKAQIARESVELFLEALEGDSLQPIERIL